MSAFRVHLLQAGLISLAHSLVWTAMMIYQVQVVGMSPLQLVLAGTVLEISILLFEIPTGIIADVYSRRLSCLIGFGILATAYVIQGAIPVFEAILVGHFLWGVGYTFTSGAYDAWLVDEVGVDRAGNAFLRGGQVARIAGFMGLVISVVLGSFALQLPILAGAALFGVTTLLMAILMCEHNFTPTPRESRSTYGKMWETLRDGLKTVRARPQLQSILAVGVFFGLFSEGWDRLWQVHLLTTFDFGGRFPVPVIWLFGGLSVIQIPLGLLASEVVRRMFQQERSSVLIRLLIGFTAVMVIGIIGYGLAPSLTVALLLLIAFNLARELVHPILQTWTNQQIESGVRATVLSLQSQIDAIGQTVGGPPIGAVGNRSLRAAFVVSGLTLAPALGLLWRLRQREAVPKVVPSLPVLDQDGAASG